MSDEIKEILKCMKNYGSTTELALLDYITNLQQENEELKKNQRYYKNGVFSLEYDKETMSDMIDDYKSRWEKALEYINKHKAHLHHSFDEPDCDYWISTNPQDIINILNGKE